jgi:hypothetical protein
MGLRNYVLNNTKELRSSKIQKESDMTNKECSKEQKYERDSSSNLKLII